MPPDIFTTNTKTNPANPDQHHQNSNNSGNNQISNSNFPVGPDRGISYSSILSNSKENKWKQMSAEQLTNLPLNEFAKMLDFLNESVINKIGENLDKKVVEESRTKMLELFGLSEVDLTALNVQSQARVKELIGIFSITAFCELNSAINYHFEHEKQIEEIIVNAVAMPGKKAFEAYLKSNSDKLASAFFLGLDVEGFKQVSNVGAFDVGINYGDAKKQQLFARMKGFFDQENALIKDRNSDILNQVLAESSNYKQADLDVLDLKKFSLVLFNTGGDELILVAVYNGKITTQNESIIGRINQNLGKKGFGKLTQNLEQNPITSFVSPNKPQDGTPLAEKDLKVRAEEEFCNFPKNIKDLKIKETLKDGTTAHRFPKINALLNQEEKILEPENFRKYQVEFMRILHDFWKDKTPIHGLQSPKDFETMFLKFLDANYERYFKLKQKVVENKPKEPKPVLSEIFQRYEKKYKNTVFEPILEEIKTICQEIDSLDNPEVPNPILMKMYKLIENFNLSKSPQNHNQFLTMNPSLVENIYDTLNQLIPNSPFCREICSCRAEIRTNNAESHTAVDDFLVNIQEKFLSHFQVDKFLEFSADDTTIGKIIGRHIDEKNAKETKEKAIVKNEENEENGLEIQENILPNKAKERNSDFLSEFLPMITSLIQSSVITTMQGPSPTFLTTRNYILTLNKMFQNDEINKVTMSKLIIYCNHILTKIEDSFESVKSVQSNFPETGNQNPDMPVTVVTAKASGLSFRDLVNFVEDMSKKQYNKDRTKEFLDFEPVMLDKIKKCFKKFVQNEGYSVTGISSWADSVIGAFCDSKRGIVTCTAFLESLLNFAKENSELTQNPNFAELVEIINQITKTLFVKKQEEIDKIESEKDRILPQAINAQMKKKLEEKILELEKLQERNRLVRV